MENSNSDCNQNQFKLIKSTYKDCWLLIHNNFIFQKNYENKDGSINWRCQNNRIKGPNKCSVTCRTLNNTFIRPPIETQHNHAPENEAKIEMHECLQTIKENVPKTSKGIKRIFDETINDCISNSNKSIEEFVPYIPKFKDVRSELYQLKHESIPKLPRTIDDIDLSSTKYNATKDDRRFLLAKTSDIFIFSSSYQLEILSQALRWHIDGTFSASPKQFYQVYTIHGWLHNEMHIGAFILLTNKTQCTYTEMFKQLIHHAKNSNEKSFELNPSEIFCDFELAAINAAKTVFPSVSVKGCHFHFCQAIKKHIKSLGKNLIF
jgi:hypothetical protein